MRVEFLGGVRTVTGSATLLETGSLKWLVDCGMFQGGKELEGRNWNLQPYQAGKLSFILFTHAPIDHSGLIPRLVKEVGASREEIGRAGKGTAMTNGL